MLSAISFPFYYIAGEKAIFTTVLHIFFYFFSIRIKNRVLWGRFLKGLCTFTSLLLLCTKHTSSFCARILLPSLLLYSTLFRENTTIFQKSFRTGEAIKNLSIIQSRQNSKRYPPRKSLSLYAEESGFCRGGFEEISKKASLIYGNGRVQNSRVSSANNTRLYLCTKSASCFCAVWP